MLELTPTFTQLAKQRGNARVGMRLNVDVRVVVFAKVFENGGGFLRACPRGHGALDEFGHAVAHKQAHLLLRARRVTALFQSRVDRVFEVVQRIEQRAVQVKDDAAIFHGDILHCAFHSEYSACAQILRAVLG